MTHWHEQMKEAARPRKEAVAALYAELRSWAKVGLKLGISRQRAWQIVNQKVKNG